MGMLFNTAATREMLDRVNAEFSQDNFGAWTGFKKEFDGTLDLHDIAVGHGLHPIGVRHKARWKHWLKQILHKEKCTRLTPYQAGAVIQYPCGGTGSNVGRELVRLFEQALGDATCAEIIMVLQPDTKVCITQAFSQYLPDMPGMHSLAITLSTIEVPAVIPSPTKKKAAKKKKL